MGFPQEGSDQMNASRRRCGGVALENAACVFETKLRPLIICKSSV